MSAIPKKLLTPEEYLHAERLAAHKSEYADGELFAMAGTSMFHNQIASNIIHAARTRLQGKPCRVLGSDMRVSPTGKYYYYPDVTIVCGQPKLLDAHQDTLLNAQVIFEVLSESTGDYDRGGKFVEYRKMVSLRDYVLVSQDQVFVEHHTRQPNGTWLLREFTQLTDQLPLGSVEISIPLAEVYEGVQVM